MDNSNIFNQDEYLLILDLTYEVAQVLKGETPSELHLGYCNELALKVFSHATTIYWLRQGTRAPVPYSIGESNFFDFPSVIVITRSLFETYLKMYEVFFEPSTDDDREFRFTLWQLAGMLVLDKWGKPDNLSEGVYEESQRYIKELKDRIQQTQRYQTLSKGEQKTVLTKGKMSSYHWRDAAKAAGFTNRFIDIYRYYSSYVHADGLSTSQVMNSQTKKEQIELIELAMFIVTVILSKIILNYYDNFPESKTVCKKQQNSYKLAQKYATVSSTLR